MRTKILAVVAALVFGAATMSTGRMAFGGHGGGGGGGHGGGGGGGFGGGGHSGGFGGGGGGGFGGGGHSGGFGGGGGGGFGGGGHSGRFGGGVGHFSSFGSARTGTSRFGGAHTSGNYVRSFNGARLGRSRGSIANISGARVRTLGATRASDPAGALGSRAAWNHWGNPHWRAGWRNGWGGWGGPVFWPYFYGDFLAFAFWPYDYYDPFWAYGDTFVWDALFWPGPDYVYGPADLDVYGEYGNIEYGGRATRAAEVRNVGGDVIGSATNTNDLTQTCSGLAPGVTDLPIDRIEKTIQPTDEQRKALVALSAASSQASDALKASCSSEVMFTPLGRLDSVQKRLDGMIQALAIVRTPLDSFYNSLTEEQKQRFAALGPNRPEPASGNDLAALCSRRAEGFTQPPVQRVEQIVKPTQQQQDALDKLKAASTEAANQLQASCPTQMPQTPMDRFDALGKRLDAMVEAIKTVRPELASFYDSLTDEQKARFNMLGPPQTAAPQN
jgi:LTXXQ motif family protein